MTAKVICFASAKGGTGKTVTAASLAKVLGLINKKVLLVDVDIDTNGMTLFYLHGMMEARDSRRKDRSQSIGVFESSSGQQPTPYKLDSHTDMIPASYSISEGVSEEEFSKAVSKTIESYSNEYDYIFLDAQAGTDSYSRIAIEHSDEVVIVSEFDPISIEGVERFKGLFFKVLSSRKTWVLLNKVLPEFTESLRDFLKVAGYLSPIPWDKDVMLAFANRELAIDTENLNEYTKAMIRTARSLMRQDAKEIESWLDKKKDVIRRPLLEQLAEVEKAIEGTEMALVSSQYRLANLRKQPARFVAYAALLFVALATSLYVWFGFSQYTIYYLILEITVGAAALYMAYSFLVLLLRKKEISLELQIRATNDILEELKDKRNKLKVLAESDFRP